MCPKTSPEPDAYDLNTEIALFRYGLIAQLVHTPPDTGQQECLLREIASRTYTIPDSTRTRVTLRAPRCAVISKRTARKVSTHCVLHPAPSRPRCSTKRSCCAKNSPPAPRRRSSIFFNGTRA